MSDNAHKLLYDFGQKVYDFEHSSRSINVASRDGSILIVDDDEDILVAGRLLLKRHYGHVATCNDPMQIPQLLAERDFDAVMLDMNFGPGESSGKQGFAWLKRILEIDPQAVVVIITAHGGVDVAVEAMKLGATDFIAKPWQNEKVVATLSASVKLRRSRFEADQLKQSNRVLADVAGSLRQPMLGDSEAMQDVRSLIERSAPTDANVLILGENGTGKELVARALYQQSLRADSVFMSVDLGAVSETLFESELFGHRKGAFTNASDNRIGRLQAANGGTLFLDEIGNIPLHLQAKLLTVLEQRQVLPVGANKPVPIDVRLLAATNLSRRELADESRFRQDLLFRLNTVEIALPPLRQRREDIADIARHYIAVYQRKYGKPERELSASAAQALGSYDWPGNIRALRHAVERAVILAEGETLEAMDFQLGGHMAAVPESTAKPAPTARPAAADDLNLSRMERHAIEQALQKHRYNISHAAKALGLTRAALYRRMEKHGL
jgi:DNA-binding NtrC family response regulator